MLSIAFLVNIVLQFLDGPQWVILSHVVPGLVCVTPSIWQRDGISLLRLRGKACGFCLAHALSPLFSASLRSLALGEASCHDESSSREKCTW